MRHRLPAVLLLALVTAATIHAQSLDESKAWIAEKLNSSAGFIADSDGMTTKSAVDLAGFDGCAFKFRSTGTSIKDGNQIARLAITFAVALPDIESVTVREADGHAFVTIKAPGRITADSDLDILTQHRTTSEKTDTAEIPFSDKAMADRVAKAMAHAVALCKKQKEPF